MPAFFMKMSANRYTDAFADVDALDGVQEPLAELSTRAYKMRLCTLPYPSRWF